MHARNKPPDDQRQTTSSKIRRLARCARGVYVLLDIPVFLRLLRVMSHDAIMPLVIKRPLVLFKYLHVNYLATHLHRREKLAMLTHHYACLSQAFSKGFLHLMFEDGKRLWQQCVADQDFSIFLLFPPNGHDFEGEMRLEFRRGGLPLYVMSVTLVDGVMIRRDCGRTLLITNIQGAQRRFDLIRQATKLFEEIAPAHLLLAALEGLACTLEVNTIAAVGNWRQLSKCSAGNRRVTFDYDRFWTSLGGEACVTGFYLFPPVFPEKPLHLVKRKHRGRTQRKRAVKRAVAQSVATGLSHHRLGPARQSSPAGDRAAFTHHANQQPGGMVRPTSTSKEDHV